VNGDIKVQSKTKKKVAETPSSSQVASIQTQLHADAKMGWIVQGVFSISVRAQHGHTD